MPSGTLPLLACLCQPRFEEFCLRLAARKSIFLRVAVGMGPAPVPGAADDAFQIRKSRTPAKFFFNFLRTGDKHRGIACAARRFDRWNRMASHAANRLDHFAHAEAAPVSEVVNEALLLFQCFENEHMRSR